MLLNLYIKNYAIIDEVEISFHPQLTVLTGETGAGKSIILGALSLILGERADTSVLIDKEHKCVIEAAFDTRNNQQVIDFLKQEELDIEYITRVRREISTAGKSRAFINDTPVQLIQLQQLGDMLVDLNRQFDNRLLHQSSAQYEILDCFSENKNQIKLYREALKKYQSNKQTLLEKIEQEKKAQAESDYLNFVLEELEQADWKENEIEQLEEQVKQAQHQEDIAKVMVQSLDVLSASEDNITNILRRLMSDWQSINNYLPAAQNIYQRIESSYEELKDLANEIEKIQDNIQFDPERIQAWNERLDLGFRMLKKHGLSQTQDLIHLKQSLSQQLENLQSLNEQIESLQQAVIAQEKELESFAQQLFEQRKKIIPKLEKDLSQVLSKIGMPTAQIKIKLEAAKHFNPFGKDEIAFMIDANQSGQFQAIAKAASGGELSRLLLAIKSLVSKNLALPTLIFDEVDAAISGEAAKQVALLMQTLAQEQQVIVLTHQAQMAAKAHQHLFVYKANHAEKQKIQTHIQLLNPEERVEKIAQMIGGSQPGQAAILSAQELLQAASH